MGILFPSFMSKKLNRFVKYLESVRHFTLFLFLQKKTIVSKVKCVPKWFSCMHAFLFKLSSEQFPSCVLSMGLSPFCLASVRSSSNSRANVIKCLVVVAAPLLLRSCLWCWCKLPSLCFCVLGSIRMFVVEQSSI